MSVPGKVSEILTIRIMRNLVARTTLHHRAWDPTYSEIRAAVEAVLESVESNIEDAIGKK